MSLKLWNYGLGERHDLSLKLLIIIGYFCISVIDFTPLVILNVLNVKAGICYRS